ncbi:MAG: VWA domain-containing protein [Gammaproteobacteria bacterium]|nr:VWA domain-containing protein [Gammaproteobacteria bacterium]
MHAELAEYLQCIDTEDFRSGELVEASWLEAQRIMSPRGLENYLVGVKAMCALGKGQDLVLTYLQEMPVVAREVGEDIVPDAIEAMMKLSSLTSGAVITLVLSNLPLAAARLGDAELLRGYLKLLHQLAGKAPRGLRPMMECLEELLSRLTLGGLRRWASWGAQAYQRDFDGQAAYFGLETETSKSILQRERRGTLFVDNHRKLNFYLRALWGRAFFMRPTSEDYESREGGKPYIDDYLVHLPDAYDRYGGIEGIDVYRAAAAHAAAHIVFTNRCINGEGLSQAQRVFVEIFEDARVEYLGYRLFPGLRRLWLGFFEHALESAQPGQHAVVRLMLRVNRALLDPAYHDPESWINDTTAAFRARLEQESGELDLVRRFGLDCFERICQQAGGMPALRILQDLPIPYRDDNRYFWAFDDAGISSQEFARLPWRQPTLRKRVGLMEMINEIDSELEDGNPQEIWVLPTELFPYEDHGVSYNQSEGLEPISEPCHYEEWDYQVQLARPEWTTVIERRQDKADPALMDRILEKHKAVASRVKHLIDALQPRGVVRKRGFEDGDELDIDAAVRAMVDIRRGVMPDPRVNIRITRHLRDLSMILLMDLSASTNDRIGELGEDEDGYLDQPRILDLTREATGLLSWAVDSIGDNFAVHGFASDGRHDVRYYRFKDFDEPYAEQAKARLAGMTGGLSTRMGAALRHAGSHLARQDSRKRLILLVTDGEPADIDERDPQYLRQDARHAVDELASAGIHSYCLTLDPGADAYVSRIFGANNYSIVDQIERLPERLPRVFSALTA